MNIGQVIYLCYFSDNDPMKKIYRGRLYKEQGEKDDAYKMFEGAVIGRISR